MIYCLEPAAYPTPDKYLEEVVCMDKNDLEWRIARVKNGFTVKYMGDPYFKQDSFDFDLLNGKRVTIKNTNCIFFQDDDFETFYDVRAILKENYTDDIWEGFEGLFQERFKYCSGIIGSEFS